MRKNSPNQSKNAGQSKNAAAEQPKYFVPEVGEVDESELNLDIEQGKEGDDNN